LTPSLFALALQNELRCRYVNPRIDSGDDVAASYKNLVVFRLMTLEFTT